MEVRDVGDDVEGDGIHPKPDEGLSPLPEIPDFDQLEKDGQEDRRITTRNEHIAGGPQEFDDWELHRPEEA